MQLEEIKIKDQGLPQVQLIVTTNCQRVINQNLQMIKAYKAFSRLTYFE